MSFQAYCAQFWRRLFVRTGETGTAERGEAGLAFCFGRVCLYGRESLVRMSESEPGLAFCFGGVCLYGRGQTGTDERRSRVWLFASERYVCTDGGDWYGGARRSRVWLVDLEAYVCTAAGDWYGGARRSRPLTF